MSLLIEGEMVRIIEAALPNMRPYEGSFLQSQSVPGLSLCKAAYTMVSSASSNESSVPRVAQMATQEISLATAEGDEG